MNTCSRTIASLSVAILSAPLLLAVPIQASIGDDQGGVWIGPVNVSPILNASVFYDSNPDAVNESRKRLMEEAEDLENDRFDSAVGYNIQPGLDLLLPGNRWTLSGRYYFVYEKDDSDYSRSPKDWSASTALQGETEGGTRWEVGQAWQQLSYETVDEFSQRDRRAIRFYGSIGKSITEKSRLSLGANYSKVEYDDEFAYDTDYKGVTLNFAHRLTEKTEALASASYGINGAEDEPSDAKSYNFSLGLGSRATEKLNFRALVGISMLEDYEYEREDGSREASETDYSMSYNLGVDWKATERISVVLSGGTAYESAEDVRQDSLLASTLVCSINYRMFQRLLLSGGAGYRHEDYLRKVARGGEDVYVGTDDEGTSRRDDQINLYANVTVGINRYASVFAGGLYSVTDSTIDDFEYDRYRLSLGVALRY